jgi:hypothetical protein
MNRRIALVGMLLVLSFMSQRCDYPGEPSFGPVATSSPGTQVSGSPYVGNIAPSFSVRSVVNEIVDLSRLRGKVVLLAFFGTNG